MASIRARWTSRSRWSKASVILPTRLNLETTEHTTAERQHSVSGTKRNKGMSGETSGVLFLFLPPNLHELTALCLRYKEIEPLRTAWLWGKHRGRAQCPAPHKPSLWGGSKARAWPQEGTFLDILRLWTTILTELWEPRRSVLWNMEICQGDFCHFSWSRVSHFLGKLRFLPTLRRGSSLWAPKQGPSRLHRSRG